MITQQIFTVWWARLIWPRFTTNKCSFVAWLALQKRIATKTRLATWGVILDTTFPLCNMAEETVEHLFFECRVSKFIWSEICVFNGWLLPADWTNLVENYMKKWKNGVLDTAKKAAWCTALYYVWKLRNDKVFKEGKLTESKVTKDAIWDMKIKFSEIKIVPNKTEVLRWCDTIGIKPEIRNARGRS